MPKSILVGFYDSKREIVVYFSQADGKEWRELKEAIRKAVRRYHKKLKETELYE